MLNLGCCGWSYFKVNNFLEKYKNKSKNWKKVYDHKVQAFADFFDLVEVNSTFYNLPKLKTAKKWRRLVDKVNKNFEFSVKCPKIITHKDRFSGKGSRTMFKRTKKIVQALGSEVVLLQTPPSFGPSKENIENMESFFSDIERDGLSIAWEPRGEWQESKEKIKKVCKEFGLIHCSDPFKMLPVSQKKISYLRLHGKPPGKEMYKYTYKKRDLEKLKKLLDKIKSKEKYVLWNNYSMYKDLKKFEKIV